MLQRMIGVHKRSWNLILYSTLWAYRTSVRNATRFTPFQLVYGLEAILPVQCEISSLKLVVDLLPETSEEEARLLELIQLDETCCDAALANEAHKKRVKAQFDKNVKPPLSQKVTWSCFTIRNPINWEQVSSSLCGWVPILLSVY